MLEAVQADSRTATAPGPPCKLYGRRVPHAGEPEDRAGDGQAELSANAQADMFRWDALDANMSGRQGHSGFAHLSLKMVNQLHDPRREWALNEP